MQIKTRKLRYDPSRYPNDCHPLLARLYAMRGVAPEAASARLRDLPSPFLMKGMRRLCARLLALIEDGARLTIAADYDADGATACAVGIEGLKRFGARVDFAIPDRRRMGYGLTPALVDAIVARGKPAAILTVDNGIASLDGVAHARRLGISVLVTDHHLPGDTLPDADVIVNPNLPGDPFPGRIAGVGVMFYVLLGLRSMTGRRSVPLEDLLDLVALGTIADMVPMNDHVNRILAGAGLSRMRRGALRPGIRALAEVSGVPTHRLGATDISFGLAPRLNAAGRLEDMTEGVRLLLCRDPERARLAAERLDAINCQRRDIERRIQSEAVARIESRLDAMRGRKTYGICVLDETWHEGVIGIVASKIKSNYNRPVIVFTRGEDGHLKGSGRSVPDVHLRDLLAKLDAEHPGMILRFGGHAMAAGLTIDRRRYEAFASAFDTEVARHLDWEVIIGESVETDGRPPALSVSFAHWLHTVEPWGQGLPVPTFFDDFRILAAQTFGKGSERQHLRLRLRHEHTGRNLTGVSFFEATPERWTPGMRVRAVFQVQVNEYMGDASLQLVLRTIRPAPSTKQKAERTDTRKPSKETIRARVFSELGVR